MKLMLGIIVFLLVAIIVYLFTLGYYSRSGNGPGLHEGKLLKCPDKKNCVCSEYKSETMHYIDPVVLPQNLTDETIPIAKAIILELGGVIQAEDTNYILASFESSIFRFIDDFELRQVPDSTIIHIRSASRVGTSDFGVNRKRVGLFKKLFIQKFTSK